MDYKLFIMVKPNHFLVMSWSLVIPKLWLIMVDPIALQLFFLSPRGCQPRSQRFRKPAI